MGNELNKNNLIYINGRENVISKCIINNNKADNIIYINGKSNSLVELSFDKNNSDEIRTQSEKLFNIHTSGQTAKITI